ncbi:MAG: hypothetical protein KF773_09720 [Deltaproteobacteria bacterium]|nr:hypothetical protein [Deltaproteobacteria bacterium]
MTSSVTRLLALLVLQCNIAACGSAGDGPCTRDEECESNFCRTDGTCGPTGVDAPPAADAPPDGPSALCTPNNDGMISANELPLVAGRMARFRIATDVTFDTAGVASGNGTRRWDLTGQLAGDADATVALKPPAGQWWESKFPGASYALTLASGSDLMGVFAVGASDVRLLGVVSPEAGSFRTELAYDPPATLLAMPFGNGATWSSTSTVSGLAQGVIIAYTERYASRVDQVGTMVTPYGEFPVVRVATDLTRTQGLATLATSRTFAWAAECFGSVANVTSRSFESSSEFTNAAEVRRLIP